MRMIIELDNELEAHIISGIIFDQDKKMATRLTYHVDNGEDCDLCKKNRKPTVRISEGEND